MDGEGNKFIYYAMSPAIVKLDYVHPYVTEAGRRGMEKGMILILLCEDSALKR